MGKPLFPLRPSGAQKPLSDGSDGDIRGGTLQQNQGHLDMPTESFSCTQEKTIFEDQKIAQGRAGWEPETFLEPAFGKSVTAQVSCAGADAPRGLGGNAKNLACRAMGGTMASWSHMADWPRSWSWPRIRSRVWTRRRPRLAQDTPQDVEDAEPEGGLQGFACIR